MQKTLDMTILKEKKLDENVPRADDKIMALLVEVGELANEIRFFKYWGSKPPSAKEIILEEYSDCMHFLISIGNEKGFDEIIENYNYKSEDAFTINLSFQYLYKSIVDFRMLPVYSAYLDMWDRLLYIGELLEFSIEDIEKAYLNK